MMLPMPLVLASRSPFHPNPLHGPVRVAQQRRPGRRRVTPLSRRIADRQTNTLFHGTMQPPVADSRTEVTPVFWTGREGKIVGERPS